jgi:hypothetical protein
MPIALDAKISVEGRIFQEKAACFQGFFHFRMILR